MIDETHDLATALDDFANAVNGQDFALVLRNILVDGETPQEACETVTGAEIDIENIQTYEQAMVLTRNAGLIIKLSNGAEFHLTIVQSA